MDRLECRPAGCSWPSDEQGHDTAPQISSATKTIILLPVAANLLQFRYGERAVGSTKTIPCCAATTPFVAAAQHARIV